VRQLNWEQVSPKAISSGKHGTNAKLIQSALEDEVESEVKKIEPR
jgi:hypothetical protein